MGDAETWGESRWTDPRSPDCDNPEIEDCDLEQEIVEALFEGTYAEKWVEAINVKDWKMKQLFDTCARIACNRAISQEEINKVASYFIDRYMNYTRKSVELDFE